VKDMASSLYHFWQRRRNDRGATASKCRMIARLANGICRTKSLASGRPILPLLRGPSPPLGHPIYLRLPTCQRGRGGQSGGLPLLAKGSLGRSRGPQALNPWPPNLPLAARTTLAIPTCPRGRRGQRTRRLGEATAAAEGFGYALHRHARPRLSTFVPGIHVFLRRLASKT